jgi:hypothetical protein
MALISVIMADDVLRHLFLGFIRLHVLYHADKEPICGVELMEELCNHGYEVRRLVATNSPAVVIIIRVMVGADFLSEGIQKLDLQYITLQSQS